MLVMTSALSMTARATYTPPSWAPRTLAAPSERLRLANLPTPIQPWPIPRVDGTKTSVYVKRDDMTGCELSGNKVRNSGSRSYP